MADDSMDEISITEDEMLAQAIALSLDRTSPQANSGDDSLSPLNLNTAPPPPMRSNTMQSTDSALTEGSFHESQSRQMSHLGTASTSSSPDLGISGGESELEQGRTPQEYGQAGTDHSSGQTTKEQSGPQLPFARLSSLHEVGGVDGSGGSALGAIWKPNKECLELIVSMGISENAAKRALFYTGNDNAELAVAWVFENIGNAELHEPFEPPPMISLVGAHGAAQMSPGPVYHSFDELLQETLAAESYKMVFVVNSDLKMSIGKIAAQVGHATLGLYRFLQDHQEHKTGLAQWEKSGCKKIVVKGDNVRQLLDLKKRAYELHIANIMVHDAGRTQVDPGSLTVFAVFGKHEQIDPLTGSLKLL